MQQPFNHCNLHSPLRYSLSFILITLNMICRCAWGRSSSSRSHSCRPRTCMLMSASICHVSPTIRACMLAYACAVFAQCAMLQCRPAVQISSQAAVSLHLACSRNRSDLLCRRRRRRLRRLWYVDLLSSTQILTLYLPGRDALLHLIKVERLWPALVLVALLVRLGTGTSASVAPALAVQSARKCTASPYAGFEATDLRTGLPIL